jgi:TPR repeat protein
MAARFYCKPLVVCALIFLLGAGRVVAYDHSEIDEIEQNYCLQKKYDLCFRFLWPLANGGDARAQTELGFLYSEGLGVRKNVSAAINWYRKAAAQGSASGQFHIASSYMDGDNGLTQDYNLGLYWARKAAAQNYSYGLVLMSKIYEKGLGVPKDSVKAASWELLCASTASKPLGACQFGVAMRFWRGRGVERDDVEAHKWANISIQQFQKESASVPSSLEMEALAKQMRDEISQTLSPAQLADAQSRATLFMHGRN